MSVEITNESAIPVGEARLSRIASFVLDAMGINPLAELSVLIVDVPHMAALNERWMGETGPTDVLAFPMDELHESGRPGVAPADVDEPDDEPVILGDIVLCPAVAISQAAAAGHSFEDELHMLTTHGILHLLGYDHMEPGEEREMFGLQTKLLNKWRAAASES
ncbi:rRNA maturation RNase YbeY [Epidermidibacterium keratini]|uniref:Endoribonuclease YbeY n=1 Tax=Epidermidibacterium keratini TaxID=1891644 RepID=A0A7L4YJU0_9ACTN|nr:rRNA maturation RNase YbeY [Epidermidibacterium keratini]QHB99327.1 rRNA maturation RNase YbeY [Epidermidibacterium keratini]